ncbi:MAG: DsbA family protein [Candidatus Cyclobacteriaceae bacterium M2_1C_046]
MNNTLKIVYIYDALCGWCYGFSPVIKKFHTTYKEHYPFEVISGGMVLGEREGPIGNIADYIKKAYKVVEDRTGVEFGQDFLNELEKGEMQFSSYLPARAMAAFKMTQTENQVDFAHAIQHAIYYEGKPPAEKDTYFEITEKMNVKPEFRIHLNLPASEELTIQDFQLTQQLKVQGFPCVFIEKDGIYVMISYGYVPYQQLDDNLRRGIEMLEKKEA